MDGEDLSHPTASTEIPISCFSMPHLPAKTLQTIINVPMAVYTTSPFNCHTEMPFLVPWRRRAPRYCSPRCLKTFDVQRGRSTIASLIACRSLWTNASTGCVPLHSPGLHPHEPACQMLQTDIKKKYCVSQFTHTLRPTTQRAWPQSKRCVLRTSPDSRVEESQRRGISAKYGRRWEHKTVNEGFVHNRQWVPFTHLTTEFTTKWGQKEEWWLMDGKASYTMESDLCIGKDLTFKNIYLHLLNQETVQLTCVPIGSPTFTLWGFIKKNCINSHPADSACTFIHKTNVL